MKEKITEAIKKATGVEDPVVEYPANPEHGDYSTNVAMIMFPNSDVWSSLVRTDQSISSPHDLAELIVVKTREDKELSQSISKIEVAGQGFINFYLSDEALNSQLFKVLEDKENFGKSKSESKKIMVEYAHPNTHKELHIGHMRTLIVGEALARILGFAGHEVFRANYQGDIGPHVAKAIWGTRKLLKKNKTGWEEAEALSKSEKAHLLGQGYALGNSEYEENKEEIHALNKALYALDDDVKEDYERTRRWSLEYYDIFYTRFDTKFDKLYFESEVSPRALDLVKEYIGKVFTESEGAVIYDGEKHGLHKRVFITKEGYPTYEGKDIALAFAQFADFAFDTNIHVVASEQRGYFEVVFDALNQIDPKFKSREYHLSMGMVQLVGKKMSSRTGDVFTVDQLLDEVKSHTRELIKSGKLEEEMEEIAEMTTMGAVKYSVLAASALQDVQFDVKKSVALDGNSGVYLQYTYARTQSVLAKAIAQGSRVPEKMVPQDNFSEHEKNILRRLAKFPEIVKDAAISYSPHIICNYLYSLAQNYNAFYGVEQIVGSEREALRLGLTAATGQTIKNGLHLLGISAPEKM
ncbi:arginine--tRNA ligase [Candidatus Woesebacteria bacterium RIFCSPHIGHO2_01_FULL_41_10]|uniref:Arginine--tRNA ligase n=1 Tax=Candidatus Woesebacteria bacterium RIFCSPHIGHO2_01_FULL_41_10 TaxID=1802500 RepID=A0A1F7YMH9_9BACT|nr:MAG: arginine--tRNA ligase [Candidatus Woesebacteria bacterium RIFCSPHIGHO2_01_FULL_41_10]